MIMKDMGSEVEEHELKKSDRDKLLRIRSYASQLYPVEDIAEKLGLPSDYVEITVRGMGIRPIHRTKKVKRMTNNFSCRSMGLCEYGKTDCENEDGARCMCIDDCYACEYKRLPEKCSTCSLSDNGKPKATYYDQIF